MSLQDGTYQIFSVMKSSSGKQFRIAQYYGNNVLVDDHSDQTVKIRKTGEDKYTLQFSHYRHEYFGPSDDISEDNRVLSRPGQYEWSIYPIGENRFKIHVPANDLYWQIPDGAGNESEIFLVNSEGTQGEFWNFKRRPY